MGRGWNGASARGFLDYKTIAEIVFVVVVLLSDSCPKTRRKGAPALSEMWDRQEKAVAEATFRQ
jgi:hypothetical protein